MSKILFKISTALELVFSILCGVFGVYILINLAELLNQEGEGIGIAIAKSLGAVLLPIISVLLFIICIMYLIFGIKTYKGATKDYETYRRKQKGLNISLILEIIIFAIFVFIMFISTEPASGLIWVIYGFMSIIVLVKLIARVMIEREYNLIQKDRVNNP